MADWWDKDAVIPASSAAVAGSQQQAGAGEWWHGDETVRSAPAASPSYGYDSVLPDAPDLSDPTSGRAVINSLANGATMGFAPRLGAAFDAVAGRAPDYATALASRNADQAAVPTSTALAGNLAGGALLPFGLLGDALKGAGTGAKVFGGLTSGGVIGGAQGAASAPDLSNGADVAGRASMGAMMGGALGAGLPVAGAAVGGLVNKAAPFIQPSPVDGMSRSAFGLLSAANGPRVQGALDTLGPNAMLLDAAPQMKGLAQGVAIKPGDAQDALVDALAARNAGTNNRLATAVDQNLGPAISPTQADAAMQSRMDATAPMYAEALGSAGPIDISPVAQQLENTRLYAKGTDAARLDQFAELLRGPGNLPGGGRMPEYDPQALQRTKFEMDAQIARTEGQTGSAAATATRDMTGVRSALNDAMGEQIPGYADANLAYGTAARGAENFTAGRQALKTGENAIWPEDLEHQFATLPLEQQALYRAGARSDIAQQMGTKPNDLQALRQVVGGENDFNRGKMGILFGDDQAQNVVGDIDRNTTFRNNYNEIVHGSQTANKAAGSALIDSKAPEGAIFPKNFTMGGLLANAGETAARKVYGTIANASNDKVRMDLAQALTAMGDARTPIADPLAEALNRAGQGGQGVRNALSSPAAIGAALAALGPPRDGPSVSQR